MQRELLTALLCLACAGGAASSAPASNSSRTTNGWNRPPTISGSPPGSVVAGEPYEFTPRASDPEGRVLKFSIQQKPAWASFDSRSGRLSGTPGVDGVGVHSGVVLAVSDGKRTVTLPAFDINVVTHGEGSATLAWLAPMRKSDGSPLSDLAGYRIYYGRTADTLDRMIVIDNPGITSYVIEGLSAARWYFSVTSVDSDGNESPLSAPVSKPVI